MIDFTATIKGTKAYKIMENDVKTNSLSHAYFILSSDQDMLKDYVKVFARLMCCAKGTLCDDCRACKLISNEIHPDVIFYPQQEKDKDSIGVNQILALIEESYIKPIESEKKVFLIVNAEKMTMGAQNKLLKTLEEPPKNVYIILGATNEFSLLPTIKSRVKKLEIPALDNSVIYNALEKECEDKQKLNLAISLGDGTIGKALSLYKDKNLQKVNDFTVDMLVNMNSSKDILKYSTMLFDLKVEIKEFLSVMQLLLRDMLVSSQNQTHLVYGKENEKSLKKSTNFNTGAILHALESVTEALKRKKFNMNDTMLVDWLLFQILEGKYKWQKY